MEDVPVVQIQARDRPAPPGQQLGTEGVFRRARSPEIVAQGALDQPGERVAVMGGADRVDSSPAYDFVSTIPYVPDDEAALDFSRTKRFDRFSEDELSHLAAKAHLPLVAAAVDAVERHLETVPIAR